MSLSFQTFLFHVSWKGFAIAKDDLGCGRPLVFNWGNVSDGHRLFRTGRFRIYFSPLERKVSGITSLIVSSVLLVLIGSHADSHRRETLPMRYMWQAVLSEVKLEYSQADSHYLSSPARQTLPLHHLWRRLCSQAVFRGNAYIHTFQTDLWRVVKWPGFEYRWGWKKKLNGGPHSSLVRTTESLLWCELWKVVALLANVY